jgi:hypothetical protein
MSAAAERLLIRHASIAIEVERITGIAQRTAALAVALGGYVERSAESSQHSVHLVLRIPETRLDAALDSVARMGRVRARQASAEDVTEQIVDLDARVAALRASRDRLRQLLDRAANVTDVVAVEHELARIQGELDSLEGRLKSMRGQVALAELTVDARERIVLGPLGYVVAGLGWVVGKLFVIRGPFGS